MKNTLNITGKANIDKLTIGVDSDDAKAAIEAAAAAVENSVSITDGTVKDAVVGIRINSAGDLHDQLATCQSKINAALGAEAPPAVTQALTDAAGELKKDKPDGKSVLEKIETASSALKNLGEVAEKAAKVAPLMSMLNLIYQGAKGWLGLP
jgi:hypothetical protein